MGGAILSQAEIEALLHADGSQLADESLTNLFSIVAKKVAEHLQLATSKALEIDGPYAERLTGNLATVISDDIYIAAADIGIHEAFLFLEKNEAQELAAELNKTAQEAVQKLAALWFGQLAKVLKSTHQAYAVQLIGKDSLAKLPVDENSLLLRHLIRLASDGVEVCLLLQAQAAKSLVEQETGQKQQLPLETQKLLASGRLIKGSISPVSEASFLPLELPEQKPSTHAINLVEDIQLAVTVELGRAELTLNEILELKPQSVITLNSHVGDAADVYINNKQSAKGEVVVLDEHFGVRILEIIPQSERISEE